MTYIDGNGKTAANYKSDILGQFSQRELDLRDDWYSFVASVRAGFDGQKKEYKLTFSDTLPTIGAYIRVMLPILMDDVEDGLNYVIQVSKLLNMIFTLPSGVDIFGPEMDPIDWSVFTETYQNKKMKYITAAWYRTQGSAEGWTSLPLTHIQMIPSININLAYDEGSYFIWNHSTGANYFLSYALGKEIANEWGHEDGIDKTIKWTYATEETTTRHLKGDHAYWTTHGYPNGRKYRIWRDFIRYDLRYSRWILSILILTMYLGLPKKIIAKMIKIISNKMKMGKLLAPSNEILDRLDMDKNDPDYFRSLEDILDRISDVVYKPYGR